MATRGKDSRLDILETSPGEEHLNIKGSKLPTYNQVLLCYLSKLNQLRQEDSCKNSKLSWDAGQHVASEVLKHYEKAHIPIIQNRSVISKIIKFHDNDYSKCVKIPRDRRNNSPQIAAFRETLRKTMPFFPSNAEDIMTQNKRFKSEEERLIIDEDVLFLKNMKFERTFTYTSQDMTYAELEAKRMDKEKQACARVEQEQIRKNASMLKNVDVASAAESDISDTEYSPQKDQRPKRRHRRSVKVGTTATIPHDILKKSIVVETALRNNISPTAAAELTRSIICASSGGDVSKVSLSYNASYKYRTEAVAEIAGKIRDSWQSPAIAALHWDGKLMDTLGNECAQEERLPILISGIGGVKLLGVPALQHKTDEGSGKKIAKATMEQLNLWKCEDNVKAMVYDTTASNTGALTAACVSIQAMLGRPLLWLACRHHVGERILVHAWDAIQIEQSKSPDISLFVRLKDNFENLQYNNMENLNYPLIPDGLAERRMVIITLCQDALKKEFSRGDYKELITLTLIYLQSKPETFKSFQRPGACHKARWMAKIIYSFKIVLLGNEISALPRGTIVGSGQLRKLEQFLQFVVFCYVPWWILAPVASAAPKADLDLIANVNMFKKFDAQVSNAALKAISLHMWYLTQELVPLSLFSHSVTSQEKMNIARAILSSERYDDLQKRDGTGFGKPMFPSVPKDNANLSDFIGPDSRFFFRVLNIKSDFLLESVEDWPKNTSYIQGKNIVESLHVVNDAAERGVKLCADFLNVAKTEDKLQNSLQVVENARGRLPNQRKRKLSSEKWWLSLNE